jgi:hypothetical protein
VRQIKLGQVTHLPAQIVKDAPRAGEGNPKVLLESEGAPDELPEGPTGFAVLPDGTFAVSDPLQKRVAVFDPSGSLKTEWRIGYAADSLQPASGGLFQVRNAITGDRELVTIEGLSKGRVDGAAKEENQAQLESPTRGALRLAEPNGRTVQVTFEQPGWRLVSIQGLGADSQNNAYVALEVTQGGGDAIDVRKIVRKYGPKNDLRAEITDIPLDYYVQPVDELRVSKGIVYQLMPLRTEVRINSWNMNQ